MEVEADGASLQSRVLNRTLVEIANGNGGDLRATSKSPTEPAGGESSPNICVICLDDISEGCTAHPCLHADFDFVCLVSWLQEHTTCPLCKSGVVEVHYSSSSAGQSHIYTVSGRRDFASTVVPASRATTIAPTSQQYHRRSRCAAAPREDSSAAAADSEHALAVRRRRYVYAHGLRSLHVGASRYTGYLPDSALTPAAFAADEELCSRARTFLRRELLVFSFLDPFNDEEEQDRDRNSGGSGKETNNHQSPGRLPGRGRRMPPRTYLISYTLAILKTVDMQSPHASDLLGDFLGRANASLLLHELRAWLRAAPCRTLREWDAVVQYAQPLPGDDVPPSPASTSSTPVTLAGKRKRT